MARPVLPVVLKDDAFGPLDVPARYVLAANNLWLERQNDLFAGCVLVEGGVPGLATHGPWLEIRFPPLPSPLLERAVGFFREVYERCGGEAILLIFYAPGRTGRPGRYAVEAPPQVVSGRFERGRFRADLRLEYGRCDPPQDGMVPLGSFHSHANQAPHHSVIDEQDEVGGAGLHLTAGFVHRAVPAFSAAFVVGRTRFAIPPERVLSPFRSARRAPREWLDRIALACKGFDGLDAGETAGPSMHAPTGNGGPHG